MKPNKEHVMLDLETVGTSSQAAIIAIGACKFSLANGVKEDDFYEVIDLQSSIDAGLKVDGSTVNWWMNQDDKARRANFPKAGAMALAEALRMFRIWLPDRALVYSCGPDFDFAILNNALAAVGQSEVEYWRSRCFRTAREDLADQVPGLTVPKRHIAHEAISDARHQAKVLCDLHAGLPIPGTVLEASSVRDLLPWIGPDPAVIAKASAIAASLDHQACWHCLATEGVEPLNVDGIPLCPACTSVANRETSPTGIITQVNEGPAKKVSEGPMGASDIKAEEVEA